MQTKWGMRPTKRKKMETGDTSFEDILTDNRFEPLTKGEDDVMKNMQPQSMEIGHDTIKKGKNLQKPSEDNSGNKKLKYHQ